MLYIPRYGPDYHRTIAEGTGMDVLNSTELGVGHYPDTQMPGEVGNFVVAAHRSAYGGGMHLINELQLGDSIIVADAGRLVHLQVPLTAVRAGPPGGRARPGARIARRAARPTASSR